MSSLPPSSLPTCGNCGGWGCRVCKNPYEVHAADGGEQGLTAAELEVLALRNEVQRLRDQLLVVTLECDERQRHLERAYELLTNTAEASEDLAHTITVLATELRRE